jgi:hypothetical protein
MPIYASHPFFFPNFPCVFMRPQAKEGAVMLLGEAASAQKVE